MRIEWGTRAETLQLGPYPARRCDACQRDRAFSLLLRYSYQYVGDPALSRVSARRYLAVCDSCGGEASVDESIVAAGLTKDPIPWQHRYGFVVGAGAMILVAVLIKLVILLG
jgi:hypothetical protein